jgi:hypothetical protein
MGGRVIEGALPPSLWFRIADRFKVVGDRTTGLRRVYDIVADPGDRLNLASTRSDVLREFGVDTLAPQFNGPVDSDERERLRALGYVGLDESRKQP